MSIDAQCEVRVVLSGLRNVGSQLNPSRPSKIKALGAIQRSILVFFFLFWDLFLMAVNCKMFRLSDFWSFQRIWKRCLIDMYISTSVHIWPSTSLGLMIFLDWLIDYYPMIKLTANNPPKNNHSQSKPDYIDWLLLCWWNSVLSHLRLHRLWDTKDWWKWYCPNSLTLSCGQNGCAEQLARPGTWQQQFVGIRAIRTILSPIPVQVVLKHRFRDSLPRRQRPAWIPTRPSYIFLLLLLILQGIKCVHRTRPRSMIPHHTTIRFSQTLSSTQTKLGATSNWLNFHLGSPLY